MKRFGFWAMQSSAMIVGLAAAFAGGAALGQTRTQTVCPVYIYMDFGTYVSYYAITLNSTAPPCGQPVSYNSPNKTLNGNCQTGTGCVPANFVAGPPRTPDRASKKRPQLTDPDALNNGIDPPNKSDLQTGADLVTNGVEVVEFHKNENGGPLLKARVFVVTLDPDELATTPPVVEKFDAGVGHQVDSGTAAQRSAQDEQVVTLSRNKRQVTILVNIQGNEWREFNILLLKTEPL
jgi:hypothetical protein